MIKRATFKQASPALMWEVPMGSPDKKRGRPLAAYDAEGNSIEIDSWEFEGGILRVNFGLDPVTGDLEYEYQVAGDDPIVIERDGNVMNITINQNSSGVASAPATFQ